MIEATTKTNTCGVGLGLSTSKKIVDALGGQIFLADEVSDESCSFDSGDRQVQY